jgi:hypothetical protein
MAGMWIKRSSWSSIKNMWIRTTVGWSPVRSGYIRVNTSGTGWKRFWFKANLPNETTKPRFNTTNTGSGTIYDGPTATSPQYLNADLFGKDGTYSNYTAITGRKISYGDTATADINSRTTLVNDDRFTSAGGVTTSNRLSVDEKYLFYEMTVENGTDPLNQINSISNGIKMIKSQPFSNSFTTTGGVEVGATLTANIDIEYYYYNRPELSSSYVKWYVGDYAGDTSGTPARTTSLSTAQDAVTSSAYTGSDTFSVTSAHLNKYITLILVAESSWTRNENYSTSSYQLDFAYAGDGNPVTTALSISNVQVKDYFGKNGLDNRDRWPTGTLNQYTGTVSGYDSNTVLRIRYRVYNYNTDLYWKPSTGTQTTASSAWDSWNSDGSGNGYISNVSVSGGVATFYDYFYLDSDFFNGGGSGPTWWLEIELSAIKSGGTRTYYVNPYETFYISKRIDPTVSVSPSTVATNSNVTISGTFAGFPASPSTNAYPRQYIIYYGDGNNSGYLPSGEWAYGTLNPTYSNTWSYSNTGTYTVTVRAVPHGEDATATVTVANLPTNTVAPTLTTNTGNFSAGSVITVNAGSWNNASSYGYELLYGTFTPIADNSTATKPLINTNQYVITNTDATASSYYFRGRVTGYYDLSQTGNSTIALTETSARSTIIPSTTISVGTATSSGFTISGTASPAVYTTIPEIQIWNSSQTSQVATITTGLPTVNTSTGAWSYVWTGGSSSTTYYARVKVRSTDSDQTTVTTGFSSSIETSAGVSTPTSLTATNNSGAIRLTFSGGSGDQYDVYYANSNTRPTDGQAFADYPNVISPYDPPLTARDITRWFWVRKSTGSTRSNWYPSGSGVSIRLPLFAPPTPVITNSAQSTSSLSWHWTQPTPSASQDQPTSWDYNISTSTSTPSSWTNRTTRPTSSSPLVTSSLSADTTYYLHVRAKNADSSTTTYQSGTTSAVTTYTLSYSANNGSSTPSSQTGASGDTITLAANAGTRSGFTFGGWNIGGTTYSGSGSYTFGSANATATAIWDAVFVEPTTSAPALQFRRLTGSQYLRWYCDYPSVSNGTIIGMGWQLSTTESTAGLLKSGTRAYPGAGIYPYNVSGVGWAFKAGVDGQVSDITYSASARYGRARVVMQGTNGSTYNGAWSEWI